jgi:DNA-binding MarR family transcriptional regulator
MRDDPNIRQAVFDCILTYRSEHGGLSPSITEIGGCVNRSAGSVRWHLAKLEEEGRITRIAGRAGGIIVNQ